MKIGIIGAMEEEVTLLRDKIDNRQTITLGGCEIYTGQLNGTEVALLNPVSVKSRRRWAQRCFWSTASRT